MAEPTSTSSISLAAIAIALLGPAAGPYALIVFASLAGSLFQLSSSPTESKAAGAFLLLRSTLVAVALTGLIAYVLFSQWQIPVNESVGAVAFLIGALGNGWRPIFASLSKGLTVLASKLGDK